MCIVCVTALTLTVTLASSLLRHHHHNRDVFDFFFLFNILDFIFHIVTMHRQPYLAEHCWVHDETFQLPNCFCGCYPLLTLWMFYCFNKKMYEKTVSFLCSALTVPSNNRTNCICIFYGCLLLILHLCFTSVSQLINSKLPKAYVIFLVVLFKQCSHQSVLTSPS